eukprot:TRINITY_DN83097_c0_g1_i1.p1 TRINITY_DN83097_c0_g1~~TRINITY_DN83097_c0_g1_i1.p1  ORF type:complete len:832 (+),score=55.23 TRINITY_DN83097_c0_g1_i1:158-2497(+)
MRGMQRAGHLTPQVPQLFPDTPAEALCQERTDEMEEGLGGPAACQSKSLAYTAVNTGHTGWFDIRTTSEPSTRRICREATVVAVTLGADHSPSFTTTLTFATGHTATALTRNGTRRPTVDKKRSKEKPRWWVRASAWTLLHIVALAAIGLPLLFDSPCHVDAWQDHPLYNPIGSPRGYVLGETTPLCEVPAIGHHFALVFLGLYLPSIYWQGHNRQSRLARWLNRYVLCAFAMSISCALIPWLFAVCPGRHTAFVYGCFKGFTYMVYVVSHSCLAQISVIRLRMLQQPTAALRASRLAVMWVVIGVTALFALTLSAAGMLPSWLLVALVASAVLVYGALQLCVLDGFLHGAWTAIEEARLEEEATAQQTTVDVRSTPSARVSRDIRTTSSKAGRARSSHGSKTSRGTWGSSGTRSSVEQAETAAHTVILMTLCLVVSAASSLLGMMLTGARVMSLFTSAWQFWILELAVTVDTVFNALLALACAGKLGSCLSDEGDLQAVGELVEAARQRQVLEILMEAARAVTGPSATLAALFEGRDPEELLRAAVKRFRCISWETLRQHPYLICGGESLDGTTVATDLYHLSEPCELSGCDAFLSHSWHDRGEYKWNTLSKWCEAFWEIHGRPPRLWFDKVCIDQRDIQTDLQCLPIFLAGCNTLLVACGKTYTTRLWCCVELFVYMKMAEGVDREIQVCLLGGSAEEEEDIAEAWNYFDFRQCRCFKEEDKHRILKCIEKNGGADGFNDYIRVLSIGLFKAIRQRTVSVQGVKSEGTESARTVRSA